MKINGRDKLDCIPYDPDPLTLNVLQNTDIQISTLCYMPSIRCIFTLTAHNLSLRSANMNFFKLNCLFYN